jgi:putative FmdB family regulatory protein
VPYYGYRCDKCEVEFDVRKPLSESGIVEACPECGDPTRKLVVPVGFVLKGDDFPGKNNRVSGQMKASRVAAGRRQDERVRDGSLPGGRLVPNVGGEQVGSWEEAGNLAKSKGKDTEGYEKKAAEDKVLTKRLNTKTT